MNGRFWVADKEMAALEMTLSITMTFEDWKAVQNELKNAKDYTGTQFAQFIGNAVFEVKQATNKFVEPPEQEE